MIAALLVALTTGALVMPVPMPLADAVKGRLSAAGAEPFWGLEIAGDTITLTTPADGPNKEAAYKIESSAAPDSERHIWSAGALTVTMSMATCSDGMSDYEYPYTVEAVLAEAEPLTFKGCAYRPWSEDIQAALPVIDACFADVKGEKPYVVYAHADASGGGFMLSLSQGGETTFNLCKVEAGKATTTPYTDYALPAGTNADAFIRGPEKAEDLCLKTPEVTDASGNVIGWWLETSGCWEKKPH